MGKAANLIGQRFGKLFVTEQFGCTADRGMLWICLCECGNSLIRATRELRRVKQAACTACHANHMAERSTTHGQSRVHAGRPSPLYKTWGSMHERCSNPKHPYFKNYGGKGVRVCAEWFEFEDFQTWAMANGYAYLADLPLGDRLSIDRIDSSRGYDPDNCRWIPHRQNCSRKTGPEVSHLQ